MSQKKHKGDHATRAVRRAQAKKEAPLAMSGKPRRVYLRNKLYIFLTVLCILGSLALLLGFELLGWWDNFLGSILVFLPGAFACICLYDLVLLCSASVAFGEGLVSAGKSTTGEMLVFHAASVVRLELRDAAGNVVSEDTAVYKNVDIAFVMESGRVNLKHVSRITDKHLAALRAALAAERNAPTA